MHHVFLFHAAKPKAELEDDFAHTVLPTILLTDLVSNVYSQRAYSVLWIQRIFLKFFCLLILSISYEGSEHL